MANLNLSEFTEKLFVADADHTFIWDTAASISKRVSRNSWLNSGTLTSDAPVTISQTWNNAAVAFTALKVNAVSTNSASGSFLLDLQVGGVSKVTVDKSGATRFYRTATDYSFINPTGDVAGYLNAVGVTTRLRFDDGGGFGGGSGLFLGNTGIVGWHSVLRTDTTTPDTILLRDGAPNTLALRNGAGVPQAFRVYNTFLGTTANEWFEIDWKVSAGTVRLFTMHGGTGVARNIDISAGATLFFGAGSGSPIKMYSGNVERWNISATGHFIAAAHNSYDIGASGANSPRDIYAGGNGIFGGLISAQNGFRAPSSSQLIASANGIWRLTNSDANDFNRLQLGGTTNSFPAIKRSSTTLQARLADDSAFAPIQGKLTTDTAFTATTVVPTGFITLYDSTGTAYKVPCVPV